MSGLLDEVLQRLEALPDAQRQQAEAQAFELTKARLFTPTPGPQTDAYHCLADELFYGGAAGGGKSILVCGLAIEEHDRSIIFRREYPQIKGLIDEVAKLTGTRRGYNSQDKLWRLPKGNRLEFGSVPHEDDKEAFQGRPHDLKAFDEITHFTESQFRFLIAWNRTTKPGQRCRVVAVGNPPFSSEGRWVISYWGAWLDPTHPNPAKPGELRWYVVIGAKDIEVDGPGPHLIDGKSYLARSRTFIPAKLEDNPDLMQTGYAAVLEGMPEPLRTMMREGRFDVAQKDNPNQVIPTAWIVAAQNRWTPDGFKDFAMTSMGFDPAGGGRDEAVIAWRHGTWFAQPVKEQGPITADGPAAAARIIFYRRDGAPVVVDAGGGAGNGFGGTTILRLKDNDVPVEGFNGAAPSTATVQGGALRFYNKRAEAWWRMREALDPDQEGGSTIALPPSAELRADLAAPTYEAGPKGIKLESKDEIKARLGRSPGEGDAVVMCLSGGNTPVRRMSARNGQFPKTNVGYPSAKRRR